MKRVVIFTLLTILTNCANYTITSVSSSNPSDKIEKFTVIWLPFDLKEQRTIDAEFAKHFADTYVPLYNLYNPLKPWAKDEFKKEAENNKVDSILVISDPFIMKELPRNTNELLEKIKEFELGNNVSLFNHDLYLSYLYTLKGNNITCLIQLNKAYFTEEDNFSEMARLIYTEMEKNKFISPRQAMAKKQDTLNK
ncbi:MAG: hypothetical protein HY606_00130 [Planctomycetes bacterium]|nr:hypothetical protein [Planctomycetota bacterium]